jgi:NRPS condensation-like uncharacterized protein
MTNKKFTLNDLITSFCENFNKNYTSVEINEIKIWLKADVRRLFKENIPKKISTNKTREEIKNFPRRLDDIGKQTIRAKNYGWNLCVDKIRKSIINYEI